MISKELLSKVLDNEVPYQVKVHKIIIKNNSLNYFYNSKDSGGGLFEANEYINIYELAHKCKEWAVIRQFYNVASLLDYTGYTCIIRQDPMTFINTELRFRAGTEPEAIFKACQWILDKDSK